MHEFFDEEASRRVASRAGVSVTFALFCGGAAVISPLASTVVIPFLVIALAVAVSAIRTLHHPHARVIGVWRHVATAGAGLAIAIALLGIAFRVFLLLRA